jgi:hypothetical protein
LALFGLRGLGTEVFGLRGPGVRLRALGMERKLSRSGRNLAQRKRHKDRGETDRSDTTEAERPISSGR